MSVAASIIGSHAHAEQIVQDAWCAVHAAINEERVIGLADLVGGEPDERAVPLSALQPDGHRVDAPRLRDDISPEQLVGGRPLWGYVQAAIERLPAGSAPC